MASHTYFCIDGHTCGNPVRVVAGGGPLLQGATMSERRQHFMRAFDWVRTGLMFEPRGHDLMSGTILYPPTRDDCDVGILYIEVTGCLPMCGHGTIGTVTTLIERGLVTPRTPGTLRLDTPAGLVIAEYRQVGEHVEGVTLTNVPSFLHSRDVPVDMPELGGTLTVDIAYGGNFYAIIERQERFGDMADFTAADLVRLSPLLRQRVNEKIQVVHPEDATIRGVSHILWTGAPKDPTATARNAVFYGDKAIDRSPCGTGTSARMAQRAARGLMTPGDRFVHESIIGSLFVGGIARATTVGNHDAIVPTVEGWARITGLNTIFIDDRDPYAKGFVVA
jgi:4-hydroxyproline epimerase